MANNPVSWFEIYVQDMERARKFYEAMLQVKLEKLNSTVPELWAFPQSFTNYGASGALAKMEGVPSGGNRDKALGSNLQNSIDNYFKLNRIQVWRDN
jgi:predicted enzyme related to lactoylglutathione lyase